MRDRHKTITPTNKKLPVFFSMKNTGSFACAPAVSKSRTRRPGAGLSAPAGSSPAMQLVVCRLPTKRFALSASSPRGCAGQFAHRVFFFPASRTHAAVSGCAPAHGSCFPRQGKRPGSCSLRPGGSLPGKSPRQTFINDKNVGPPVPPRTETPEKLSSAPWLFGRFPYQPAVCGPKGR